MRDPQSRSRIRPVIIQINSDWRIRSDPYNWIIETRRKGGTGERWNAVAYYGDLDRAVLGLVQRRIRVMEGTLPCRSPRATVPGSRGLGGGNLGGTGGRGYAAAPEGGRMTRACLRQTGRHGTQLGKAGRSRCQGPPLPRGRSVGLAYSRAFGQSGLAPSKREYGSSDCRTV